MKATGVVRKLDSLGRIVIPIELRRVMSIQSNDPIEISIDSNSIVIEKYIDRCYICSNTEDLKVFKEKHICHDCIDKL
ncbi:AbrB/MazE/SpoVT family DNA-binding domain-containing protein [Wukongibacter baidiensis]|uniref:AbrB/MazE/SpoVT family DNA-binding domain-containing protein n=1 Tax=Wukongibacter baidiensis TaxID=1723361 RepID=UPI003D7F281F